MGDAGQFKEQVKRLEKVYADRFKVQLDQINFLSTELQRVKSLVKKFLTPDQLGQLNLKVQTPPSHENSIRQGESEIVNSTSVQESRSFTAKNTPKGGCTKYGSKVEHADVH
jgi:hypothetical protein